ncbi:phospholipase D family protein [Methylobacterium sp. 37f]|uniref:phospholipase D family protein n=1 Tax=Methylobacterium sp. 37f TaxID=2817058 RepID=UPI001FFCADF4|nr:phospholipase D family protein [Methylobacterium sp. 37f]MCK2057084.1 phospholipase D family protein [Methylobacterium sp. 37f]
MVRLVSENWFGELKSLRERHTSKMHIVCPFIKDTPIYELLKISRRNIRVITRFNLVDFAQGVSDISALRRLLVAGAQIQGIKNLHSKMYIFGSESAAVTSANLTLSGLNKNHEVGVIAENESLVQDCNGYFDRIWRKNGQGLQLHQLDKWEEIISKFQLCGGSFSDIDKLEDFGEDQGIPESNAVANRTNSTATISFVKFLGANNYRSPLTSNVLDEIGESACHWALAYPKGKRPRAVHENSTMFIGKLTKNPHDIYVFGIAIGKQHEQGRDDASELDIAQHNWKETWPHYIRVHQAEFVAGTIGNGVSLNQLMDKFESSSFEPTKQNAIKGSGNMNPRKSYRRMAAVRLSEESAEWLHAQLQNAFSIHGKVATQNLDSIGWPNLG